MGGFPVMRCGPGPFGSLICTSSGEMSEQSGPHIKGCEFRIPHRFAEAPGVSASVTTVGAGNALLLYGVGVTDGIGENETQVVVYAQTWDAKPAKGRHVCSLIVTGMPRKA